jgi:hypothetical protein
MPIAKKSHSVSRAKPKSKTAKSRRSKLTVRGVSRSGTKLASPRARKRATARKRSSVTFQIGGSSAPARRTAAGAKRGYRTLTKLSTAARR